MAVIPAAASGKVTVGCSVLCVVSPCDSSSDSAKSEAVCTQVSAQFRSVQSDRKYEAEGGIFLLPAYLC